MRGNGVAYAANVRVDATLDEIDAAPGDGVCVTSGGPNTDPMLGPLEDNGDPTRTHDLMPGTPAIDAADNGPDTDQRGFLRPFDGDDDGSANCDIGAVEAAGTDEPTLDLDIKKFTVTKRVSLRQANSVKISLTVITPGNASTADEEALATVTGTTVGMKVYTELDSSVRLYRA